MENIKIPWKGWKIVKLIGKGSYDTVYELERTVGSYTEKAAMKVIPIPPNQQLIYEYQSEGYSDESIFEMCKSLLDDTVNEYSLMRSMNGNRNIVSCDDIEYSENCCIFAHVKQKQLGIMIFNIWNGKIPLAGMSISVWNCLRRSSILIYSTSSMKRKSSSLVRTFVVL